MCRKLKWRKYLGSPRKGNQFYSFERLDLLIPYRTTSFSRRHSHNHCPSCFLSLDLFSSSICSRNFYRTWWRKSSSNFHRGCYLHSSDYCENHLWGSRGETIQAFLVHIDVFQRLFIALYGHGFCMFMRNEMFRKVGSCRITEKKEVSVSPSWSCLFRRGEEQSGKTSSQGYQWVFNIKWDHGTETRHAYSRICMLWYLNLPRIMTFFPFSVFSIVCALFINWKMALLCSFQFPAYFIIRVLQIREGTKRSDKNPYFNIQLLMLFKATPNGRGREESSESSDCSPFQHEYHQGVQPTITLLQCILWCPETCFSVTSNFESYISKHSNFQMHAETILDLRICFRLPILIYLHSNRHNIVLWKSNDVG